MLCFLFLWKKQSKEKEREWRKDMFPFRMAFSFHQNKKVEIFPLFLLLKSGSIPVQLVILRKYLKFTHCRTKNRFFRMES